MLNKEQLAAVRHRNGPAMILAGPGSGKTTVITNRIKYLIDTGVRPENILVITFTRAAAGQMKARFLRMIAPACFRVTFGTFHSVFFKILEHESFYKPSSILQKNESFRILSDIINSQNIGCGDINDLISDVLSEISRVKTEQIPLRYYYSLSMNEEDFRRVCSIYADTLRRRNKIDFDDMCVFTLDLLRTSKDILRRWQEHFRYILVDEFQDINLLQYRIVRLLAQPEDNLFIVGDDDQSIYHFRGSSPAIMLNFTKDYPGASVIELCENYRSSPQIVDASVRVISENKDRFSKRLYSRSLCHENVEVLGLKDLQTEMLCLVQSIRKSITSGIRPSEIAILTRTNLEGIQSLQSLCEFSIPCRVKDEARLLWDHFVAQDIIAYLQLAEGEYMDRRDFLRVCNRPDRHIQQDWALGAKITFNELKSYYIGKIYMNPYIEEFEKTVQMVSRMRPYAAVNYIRKGARYDSFLVDYAQKRRLGSGRLIEIADMVQESARGFGSLYEWKDHIAKTRSAMEEMKRIGKEEDCDMVTLSTLHGSKGLEFTEVFLLNVNEGTIPFRKAGLSADVEEERRLFYVGMTRAKRKLHLYYLKERCGRKMEKSHFLDCLSKCIVVQ